jgi:regulator of cell morphogenesis and NO signaling
MEVTAQTLVEEAAARFPRAMHVFEMVGVDYCCSGRLTIGEGARAAYIAEDELIDLILGRANPASQSPAVNRNWDDADLPSLTRHIVEHYHRGARRLLVDLTEDVRALISGHAAKHPELRELQNTLDELAHDLVPHMIREERYLFPYIETMDQPIGSDDRVRVPLFGTVEYPLQSIRHDHSEDLTILGRIRQLSLDFAVPSAACDRYRRFCSMLADLDRQLTRHIHLENAVLFPRAIAMERKIASRPRA